MNEWPRLSEEERYGVWSLYVDFGGLDLSYPDFCDLMESMCP